MTGDVVRALRATPREEIERWLAEHDINGLPVVDADEQVIGVVSATDLQRTRQVPGRNRTLTAGELMSAPPLTVRADDSLIRAARIMTEQCVERLPVLDEEARLVGIVTRRDLLQIFVRPDADIRDEVIDEVMVRALWLSPHTVNVTVHGGVVTLSGDVENRIDESVAVRMTRQVHGVVAVMNHLTHRQGAPHRPGPAGHRVCPTRL
ncbi:CBS domain-containing protein [Streptomyces celluloflavus]|uniref:CBS domain-containing protein n=1 Tax=Streptomyces celluloflavus TaxID=58344 RepID=UPI0036BEA998